MDITKKTAAALGFFDGLHLGHKAVISKAYEAGERLGIPMSVLTFSGEPALPKFGGRRDMCLMTYEEKKDMLRLCGAKYIAAYKFSRIRYMSPEAFFKEIILHDMNAAYIACGEDFRFGRGGKGDATLLGELCRKHGTELEVVPQYCVDGVPVSSSNIRALIRDGKVYEALKLLGHGFSFTLPVEHGRQLGRTMGFPTINQRIPEFMVHPKRGVYASYTFVDGTAMRSITNIGTKPTVKDDDSENMETHILGYDGELYDKNIRVELIRFIRPEKKFGSLDELKAQLESDKNAAIGFLTPVLS